MSGQIISDVAKVINIIVWVLLGIAMVVLIGMMLLTVVDVGGRYLINKPILGSMEVTEVMMVCLAFIGLVWCTMKNVHIKLDLLTGYIPPKVRTINDTIFFALGMVLFSLMSWQNFLMAKTNWIAGHSSAVINIPKFPFYLVVSITCGVTALILMLFIIQNIIQVVKKWR